MSICPVSEKYDCFVCVIVTERWRGNYYDDGDSSIHISCIAMTSPLSETSISQWDTVSDSDTVFEDVYEMFEVIAKW